MSYIVNSESANVSDYSYLLADGHSREFIWVCELSKEKPSAKWEIEADDGDGDFLCHTLFLKQAVLGAGAENDEINIVSVETKDFYAQTVKQPIISLTSGITNSCILDLNFSSEIPVTFHLTSGTGPVFITGAHFVDFPQEPEDAYDLYKQYDWTEQMLGKTADQEAGASAEQEDGEVKLNSKKRKAASALDKRDKRRKKLNNSDETEQDGEDVRFEVTNEEDDDEGEDEEDNEESDDDDDEEEEEEGEDDESESIDEDFSDDSDDGGEAESDEELSEPRKPLSSKGQSKSGTKADEARKARAKSAAEQKSVKQMQSKSALHSKTASKKKQVGNLSKKSPSAHAATGKSRQKKSK